MPDSPSLKILILGLNYAPEKVGIAVYTSGLAETLVARGHAVSVIAGKPYYPAWTPDERFRKGWVLRGVENGVDVTRVTHYVPSRPSGLRRVAHHLSFALASLTPALQRAREMHPDVVLTVAPSLIAAPVAWLSAAIVGAGTWLHLQDFEVEAAMATGLVRGGVSAAAGRGFESMVLRLFERVSSISPAMCRKLYEKGVEAFRVVEFRNWAEIDGAGASPTPASYRDEWGISTPHVALYSGNIANKQGIEIVVAAARRLRRRSDLTFIVCGEGPNRANLEARAADLDNIMFFDLQPKQRLAELLGLATVHLLPQLGSAADLLLPSKLTNMLASGRPIVATAHPQTSLAAEIEGCGLIVPPGDDRAFAQAIQRLIDDAPTRLAYGDAGRRRASQRWRRETIIDGFEGELSRLAARPRRVVGAGSA